MIANQYRPFYQHSQAQPQGYVPEYLNTQAAIPLGGVTPEGTRQFISQLGLPSEEAFQHFHFNKGVPAPLATTMDYMGGLSPLPRVFLEQMFNRQFYSGRKLSDLRPQGAVGAVGGLLGDQYPRSTQLAAQILANSPASRFLSTADKLMDPRKAAWQKALT